MDQGRFFCAHSKNNKLFASPAVRYRAKRESRMPNRRRRWGGRAAVVRLVWLILLELLGQVDSHEEGHSHGHDEGEYCGAEVPTIEEEAMNQVRVDAFQVVTEGNYIRRRKLATEACHELCDQCIEIETHLHMIGVDLGRGPIIPHPTFAYESAKEDVALVGMEEFSSSDDVIVMFEENIKVLNNAFAGTPFRFRFVRGATRRATNANWVEDAASHMAEMSRYLGSHDLRRLDVFLSASLRTGKSGEVLGTASLPGSQLVGRGDGVFLRYDVLTNGGRTRNDKGYALVHEVGHWLGLLHTFQKLKTTKPCSRAEINFNDFVEDTPMQDGPTSLMVDDCRLYLDGGLELPDTCPNLPGKDAMFNYLNYVGNDECLDKEGTFTCGQRERMWKHWILFRDQVTSCEDPDDMEIEMTFAFDNSYGSENRIILRNKNGRVVFDSLKDHWVAYLVARERSLYMDVCAPRDMDYELQIFDRGGDGFRNGNILLFTDRIESQRVEGDFGAEVTLQIPARPPKTPSSTPSSAPSFVHSQSPSLYPTVTARPTQSAEPTVLFSSQPSFEPSSSPIPSAEPSTGPSSVPSPSPTDFPTTAPSEIPSYHPSLSPSKVPTSAPTDTPSEVHSGAPSSKPSHAPTSEFPSISPSGSPTEVSTSEPSGPAGPKSRYYFVPVTTERDRATSAPHSELSAFTESTQAEHPHSSSDRIQLITGTIVGPLLLYWAARWL